MRIIETVFPLSVPQQPRVFTLEVDEDEMEIIIDALMYDNECELAEQLSNAL